MTPKELTEMITRLLNNGWTPEDIDDGFSRLAQMRLMYQQNPGTVDHDHEQRRLEFIRWLFEHGKISH